jgi:hypothetical protein
VGSGLAGRVRAGSCSVAAMALNLQRCGDGAKAREHRRPRARAAYEHSLSGVWLKTALVWALRNCSPTKQHLNVRSTPKDKAHDMRIQRGVGMSFEGLGGGLRSRDVLPPSEAMVKFRAHSQVRPPDIGVGSLYTQFGARTGLSGIADVISPLESACLKFTAVWAPHNFSLTSHDPDICFTTNVQRWIY